MTHEITVPVPHTAADAAAIQRQAEADADEIEASITVIATPEAYAVADEILTEIVTRKDALEAMQSSATVPLNAVLKTIRGWFAPGRAALERAEKHIKAVMGNYQLAKARTERLAREAAAVAAATDEGEGLIASLTLATEASQKAPGRATARFIWVVERIAADLLPAEYFIPDEKRIAAEGRAHKGDEPPVIPGVVWTREAQIGARR